ncbi:hypothetical protein C8F01DRAFT_1236598 [Mycena amicta]|nr:hypothetical protein C8F01DRAFT_1236598 [Mycena amicta]
MPPMRAGQFTGTPHLDRSLLSPQIALLTGKNKSPNANANANLPAATNASGSTAQAVIRASSTRNATKMNFSLRRVAAAKPVTKKNCTAWVWADPEMVRQNIRSARIVDCREHRAIDRSAFAACLEEAEISCLFFFFIIAKLDWKSGLEELLKFHPPSPQAANGIRDISSTFFVLLERFCYHATFIGHPHPSFATSNEISFRLLW